MAERGFVMNILIVGNDRDQRNGICTVLSETYAYVRCFAAANYSQAIQEIKKRKMQMFLLDVGLDIRNTDEDGIALGVLIRSKPEYSNVPIIYIGGDPAHALAAIHSAKCCDYLLKTCRDQEIFRAVDKYISRYVRQKKLVEFRLPDRSARQIPAVDIEYIESFDGHLYIHTKTGTIIAVRRSMRCVLDMLPDEFVRVHRSYIVNMQEFRTFDVSAGILLIGRADNPLSVPVSRAYKNAVKAALNLEWQLGGNACGTM